MDTTHLTVDSAALERASRDQRWGNIRKVLSSHVMRLINYYRVFPYVYDELKFAVAEALGSSFAPMVRLHNSSLHVYNMLMTVCVYSPSLAALQAEAVALSMMGPQFVRKL